MIIDDIAMNHDILKEQLSSESCNCISVTSAQKGLNVLAKAAEKNVSIDLVIVDYQMPQMTGEDFIRIVKSHHAYKNIPLILYSSVNHDGLKQRLKAMGVDGYITKPTRYNQLLRTVSKAISSGGPPVEDAIKGAVEADPVTDITPMVHQKPIVQTAGGNEGG